MTIIPDGAVVINFASTTYAPYAIQLADAIDSVGLHECSADKFKAFV